MGRYWVSGWSVRESALAFVDAFVKSAPRKKLVVVVALLLFMLASWFFGMSARRRSPITSAQRSCYRIDRDTEGSKLESHVTAFGLKTNQWVCEREGVLRVRNPEAGVLSAKPELVPIGMAKVDLGFTIPVALNRFQRQDRGSPRGEDPKRRSDPCFESPEQESQAKDLEPVEEQSCATIFPPTGQTPNAQRLEVERHQQRHQRHGQVVWIWSGRRRLCSTWRGTQRPRTG